jgi:tetratricopeptide (TPR) repeat protein
MPQAREAAMKALEIDPTLAGAHATLAVVSSFYDWNWSEADSEFERALSLNPSSFSAHYWYAIHLGAMGRFSESIAEMRRAQEIDPLNLSGITTMAGVYWFAREYDRAVEELERALELQPDFSYAHLLLSWTYEQKGMWDEKIASDQKFLTLTGASAQEVAALGQAYAVAGVQGSWEWWLEWAKEKATHGYFSDVQLARSYMLVGDADQAFQWLERGYQQRDGDMLWLENSPWFDPFRSDPRFQDLLRRMNFPD